MTSVPQSPSVRRWVELKTGPFLVLLHRAPRFAVALLPPVLIIGGLAAPPVLGLIPLLLGAAFLGWLAYLSWPRVEAGSRVIRVGFLVFVVGYGLYRAVRG